MALTADPSTQLGCGRDIDQVWDHLDRAPDAHEITCPYCQTARADLAGLAEATAQLRDDDANNPELQPSPAVLDRILAVARSEVRRGRRLPLDQPDPDATTPNTISEQALTAVVRRVGDRTNAIQIRRCTITVAPPSPQTQAETKPEADDEADDDAAPGRIPVPSPHGTHAAAGRVAVTVSLKVSVSRDLAIAAASRQLRAAIIEAVDQEVGMDVTAVNVAVEDLHDA